MYTVSKTPHIVVGYYLEQNQYVDYCKHQHRYFVKLVVGYLIYRIHAEYVDIVYLRSFKNLDTWSSSKNDQRHKEEKSEDEFRVYPFFFAEGSIEGWIAVQKY